MKLLHELELSTEELKVIHGDLHHDNILFDQQKGWLAIDPKGRIGDPIYNSARILRNYWNTTPTESIVRMRIEILAECLGCERARVAAWAFLDCVLSEAWNLDELNERKKEEQLILNLIEAILDSYPSVQTKSRK